MSTKLTPAMLEIRAALNEADALSAKQDFTKREESRMNFLLAKIASLRADICSQDDFCKRWFRALISGSTMPEQRTAAEAGINTPTWTSGNTGGYIVPQEFSDQLILGLSQNDPLLDENVVTLIRSKNASLRPYPVPGWDLTNFTATKITEGAHQNPQTPITASVSILNGFTYRAMLDASFELEDDDFQPVIGQFSKAFAAGFARGIGVDLITGNGTTAPQGVLTGAHSSSITTGTTGGVITADDIENIFFSINRIYRQSPKCSWLMSDTTYQAVRKAKDSNNRPLISVVNGQETLMDKPVYVCPSMPSYTASVGDYGILFGDLSHYVVRVSTATIQRTLNVPGGAENGVVRYIGIIRCDAKVVDPSSNAILYSTLHV